jgi:hypothetical protein
VVALAVLGLRPAPLPRFLVLTANPPLIGAGLVGCMRNRQKRKGSQCAERGANLIDFLFFFLSYDP